MELQDGAEPTTVHLGDVSGLTPTVAVGLVFSTAASLRALSPQGTLTTVAGTGTAHETLVCGSPALVSGFGSTSLLETTRYDDLVMLDGARQVILDAYLPPEPARCASLGDSVVTRHAYFGPTGSAMRACETAVFSSETSFARPVRVDFGLAARATAAPEPALSHLTMQPGGSVKVWVTSSAAGPAPVVEWLAPNVVEVTTSQYLGLDLFHGELPLTGSAWHRGRARLGATAFSAELLLRAGAIYDCAANPNPLGLDRDSDGLGDVCDNCPMHPNAEQADADGDGLITPAEARANQALAADSDGDGLIDAVESSTRDVDGNVVPDQSDPDVAGRPATSLWLVDLEVTVNQFEARRRTSFWSVPMTMRLAGAGRARARFLLIPASHFYPPLGVLARADGAPWLSAFVKTVHPTSWIGGYLPSTYGGLGIYEATPAECEIEGVGLHTSVNGDE